MKKTLLLSILALLGLSQAAAQEYEYVPFVREGVKWEYYIRDYHYDSYNNPEQGNNVVYRTLELKGDTVINGKTYKAMHMYCGDRINEQDDIIPVYLREEDKVVYGIIPDGRSFDDCPVYNSFDTVSYYNGQEFVLYDFKDPIAYWEGFSQPEYYPYHHLYTDTISIGKHLAKRYVGEMWTEFQQIEGIGLIAENSTPLSFFMLGTTGIHDAPYFGLEKVVENGEVIYPQNYVEDRYLPVIREGVKWINEKVIVNHGDTTRYYYTYQFNGLAPFRNGYNQALKALYYSDNSLENDSLIAGLKENEAIVLCYNNYALNSVIDQDRNMIDFYTYQNSGGTRALYGLETFYDGFFAVDFFIESQRDQFLTKENFVNVDPIEIDGVKCARCAYVDEQGDTMCYVVEGIGFDSRDMGDLLTPFTRKPDPNADYQEYCGLSHVIKDGKIIYKGMRFNPNAVVIPGDVDGDGEITISDANSVIDIVVMGGNAGHTHSPAADANGDGEVTIADVNAIVTMIMDN